jgi:hypothetical protein
MSGSEHIVADDIVKAIDAKHELMRVAFERNNADIIGKEFFSPGAWLVGPDDATWKGTSEIVSLYKDFVGAHKWETTRERLISTGEGGVFEFRIGTTVSANSGEKSDFKLLFVWSKFGEKWACAAQFYASGSTFN